MGKTYFTLTEENSNNVIAVIKSKTGDNGIVKNPKKVKKLVSLAVKEEWIYERVELVEWNYNESNNSMVFNCYLDGGESEIRIIDLTITTLYK